MPLDYPIRFLFKLDLLPSLEASSRNSLISSIIFRYIVEKKGVLCYLIPGVCFNIIAVVFNTITYHFLSKDQKKNLDIPSLLESADEAGKVF